VKVLLVVIDAATPRVVCPAIRTGALRTLHALADAGAMHESSVTIFPSITPAATTSIVTGEYPAEHGIAGAAWYDEARQEIAYYGDDFWIIAREGFGAFLRDFLIRLNGDRLLAPTVFETAEGAGRETASLNYLVHRGPVCHRVNVPLLLTLLPGVPFTETVAGPSILYLGSFVKSPTRRGKLKGKEGLLHRFGMDDASSGRLLCEMMARRALPDLTVVYFANNDYRSHEVGPHAALSEVAHVDRLLDEAFGAAGGLERVLSDTMVIVTSDHGHCEILADRRRAVICLDELLANYRHAALGRAWRRSDEVMVCPNMRAAQVYFRQPTPELAVRVASDLLRDNRVDQVISRATLERAGGDGYVVRTRRGTVEFRRATESGSRVSDVFGGMWTITGDLEALGLERSDGVVDSLDYPNALERIAGVLDSDKSGDLWVTAVPGCEFEVPGGKAHVGGASHGALHALDSLSPVVLAGPPAAFGRPALPRYLRSVDIAPLCLEAIGVPSPHRIGQPRLSPRNGKKS
jgi:hypothetical protein